MPPQLQALLQNRQALAIIVAVVLALVIGVLLWHPWDVGSAGPGGGRLQPEQRVLATVDSLGKAIEIQALLAREGIRLDRMDADGGKAILKFSEQATQEDRDRALITLVQSGLMDKNVGLEAFDHGDMTASREEKRIKLVRAQQGELARLIRKIKPIEEASVSLSIPEPTLFRSEQKPMSASIQVTIPVGERLDRDKVRSIINLIVGSVQGLDDQHIALADTNGNTYNSVLGADDQQSDKLEEQDQYMKQKVASQLDRLVGSGNYVVTVSTLLREAPKETFTESYHPEDSAVAAKQSFSEDLNAKNTEAATPGGPSSTFLPNTMAGGSSEGNSEKGYSRQGTEVTYANAKTQSYETQMPGILEDISIAVTLNKTNLPANMAVSDLKLLLARAASPKVNPENVSIVLTDFANPSILPDATLPEPESPKADWIPWAVGAVAVCMLGLGALAFGRNSGKDRFSDQMLQHTQQELEQLKAVTMQQAAQIEVTQQEARKLAEEQRKQIIDQQQQQQAVASIGKVETEDQLSQAQALKQTLDDIKSSLQPSALLAQNNDLDEEDEAHDLDLKLRNWIESS